MSFTIKIKKLTKQLLPTGRAFKVPPSGDLDKLIDSINLSEARAYDDGLSILYDIIPDNTNFTVDDATDWERRLGLITNPAVSLSDRMAAILRKMNHPGTIKARQNYRYLQEQLQLAGFDLYVYENRFPDGMGGYITRTVADVVGSAGGQFNHGEFNHNQYNHGTGFFNEVVVNSLDNHTDMIFDVGSNLRSTFFVGGTPLGTFASIPKEREIELRQLILKIKPTQCVAYLILNYV